MTRSTFTRVPIPFSLLCAALLTASWVSLPQALSRAEHVRGAVVSSIGTMTFADERPPDFWAERGYDYYLGH